MNVSVEETGVKPNASLIDTGKELKNILPCIHPSIHTVLLSSIHPCVPLLVCPLGHTTEHSVVLGLSGAASVTAV